jgi:hypothetical protein
MLSTYENKKKEIYFHQAGKNLGDEKIHHESLNTFPSPTFPG